MRQGYGRDGFRFGVGQRKACSRADLARWDAKLRRGDALETLGRAMRGRLPALLKLKDERMRASPFGFFRGAVPVMASDLAQGKNTGVLSQLCGDAHVQNLGAYAGTDGRLVFDINDFDETVRGPFEWDVKRMATSLLLAGGGAEIKEKDCSAAVERFLTAYCGLIEEMAKMPVLEVARYQVHRLLRMETVSEVLGRAERETPMHTLDRLTEKKGKARLFRTEPPVLRRLTGDEAKAVLASLKTYSRSLLPERRRFLEQFRPVDVAFKVVGTGSVGLRDYCVYLEGNGANDPLFLQVKQEVASAYAGYVRRGAAWSGSEGERVAVGQRAMQLQSDPLLGWTRFGGNDYLVRQLNDHKAGVDTTKLTAEGLAEYATVCGELLARGHGRSGSAAAVAGYVGNGKKFRVAVREFAEAYAEQTVRDWKELVKRGSAAEQASAHAKK